MKLVIAATALCLGLPCAAQTASVQAGAAPSIAAPSGQAASGMAQASATRGSAQQAESAAVGAAPTGGARPAVGASPAPGTSAAGGVSEPKVQYIVIEDDRVRVDELRVRGQTRRITVQPKLPGAPAYQIGTNADARDPQMDPRSEGRALWQIFGF